MTIAPDYLVTPGDYIEEWLEDNNIKAAELARRMNVTRKHVSELIHGKAPVTPRIALALERVTGVPERLWNAYETTYREDLLRLHEERDLVDHYDEAKKFPLKWLKKHEVIRSPLENKADVVRDLLSLLKIASFDAFPSVWATPKVAYRKVSLSAGSIYSRSVWFALGERQVKHLDLPEYSTDKLETALAELRTNTRSEDLSDAINKAIDILREAGVALCLTPSVPGFGVSGATRWIGNNPVIQLSERGQFDDQLWFTLFHEIGHVLKHRRDTVYLDNADSTAEDEANAFATEVLIPKNMREHLPKTRNLTSVVELAEKLEIAPSIVLGQSQRLTGDYGWGHNLRKKLDWETLPQSVLQNHR